MVNLGLGACVPVRLFKSKARSLTSLQNRDKGNWWLDTDSITEKDKKRMLAQMVKIGNIVTINTTCYSFGGDIFRQAAGAGIGLRSLDCLARITMGFWDQDWAKIQNMWTLKSMLFVRYVDDIRIFCYPLKPGWFWSENGWIFDGDTIDERDDETRTREEIGKSLNGVMNFLRFTVETQKDFENNMLPTLDVQLRVGESGIISFSHFSKPTNNNICIQRDTALSTETIFSSLRQELIRRLKNLSADIEVERKCEVVEEFIKLMVNSGHKFAFIKAIVMQVLTKFNYLVERSKKCTNDKTYLPLYRENAYKRNERLMLKYIAPMVWYTDDQLKDPFRNKWKLRIKRRQRTIKRCGDYKFNNKTRNKSKEANLTDNRVTTTTLFVPSMKDSKLL